MSVDLRDIWLTPLVAVLALLQVGVVAAAAQSVTAANGNIFFVDSGGARRQLTRTGRDSEPVLSPDRRQVAFVRSTPDRKVATPLGDEDATELWIVDRDGRGPELLVRGRASSDMRRVIASIRDVQFSADGRRLYFRSSAWVTSAAVHAVDLATRRVSFVCDGNAFEIVPRGEYKDHLLVRKHKYFIGGGSYDWIWLVRPDGTELGPVGEDATGFKELYVK